MIKDTLLEIFNKFGESKAVFIKTNKRAYSVFADSGDIVFELKNEYNIDHAPVDHDDPVVKTMKRNYSEHFVKQDGKFVKSLSAIEATKKEILNQIKIAFTKTSTLKQPHQSKLYKWLEFSIMNHLDKREGMIALYRYIYKHTNEDLEFEEGPNNQHAKNVVAILEKMKEKYE